jgi:uncharacterized protein (TIRG00374 family)
VSGRRHLRFWGGFAFTSFFLWLALRGIDYKQMAAASTETRVAWVAASVAVFFFGYSCRIERWRLMLARENPSLTWRQCAGPLMASVAANNVLPLRAGDLLRAFGFNRRLGISVATSLTTLAVERLMDLLVVVSLLSLTLTLFGLQTSRFLTISGALLFAGSAAILAVLAFPSWLERPVLKAAEIVARPFPRLSASIYSQANMVFATLEYASRGRTISLLLTWSIAAWLAEGLVFWLAANAVPAITQPAAAWLAMPLASLATALPSTPGFFGTFHYFAGQAMVALGNPISAAAAYAFLVHATLWLSSTVVGGLYLLLRPINRHFEAASSTT